jgi:hypothetical protein
MKKQFTAYLKSIGMSDVLIRRVETIHKFYQDICPEEITGIFVNDFMKEDGNREYESLWLFSQTYVMEAKSFISKDKFDMTPLHKKVTYWKIEKQDYDFAKATEKSRVNLQIVFCSPIDGIFKASKENCDFLRNVFLKHIMPNLS